MVCGIGRAGRGENVSKSAGDVLPNTRAGTSGGETWRLQIKETGAELAPPYTRRLGNATGLAEKMEPQLGNLERGDMGSAGL